jgi:hypothetical protein
MGGCMKFDEIIHRLTGFSVPIFGISWNPPESETKVARRIVVFLEDKRVLYNPFLLEVPEYCIQSIIEIRNFLTKELSELPENSELAQSIKAMRIACRKFLDNVSSQKNHHYKDGFYMGNSDGWVFISGLGELRNAFGTHLAIVAAKYNLSIEDQLATILPGDGRE